MFVMHIWYPILSVPVNLVLTVLWIVSFAGQAGPDHSDPEHPSSVAWYINKSCDYAIPSGNKHYCLMAKGTFAITVVMAYATSTLPSPICKPTPLTSNPQIRLPPQPPLRHLVHDPHARGARHPETRIRRSATGRRLRVQAFRRQARRDEEYPRGVRRALHASNPGFQYLGQTAPSQIAE